MLMIDGNGTPLSVFTLSANQAEVNALENLVDIRVTKKKLKRMLYDKVADAYWVRERLDDREIELICPHRRGQSSWPEETAHARLSSASPLQTAVQSRMHDQLALQPQATRCALRVSRLSLPRVCTTRMPIYNSQGVLKLPLRCFGDDSLRPLVDILNSHKDSVADNKALNLTRCSRAGFW